MTLEEQMDFLFELADLTGVMRNTPTVEIWREKAVGVLVKEGGFAEGETVVCVSVGGGTTQRGVGRTLQQAVGDALRHLRDYTIASVEEKERRARESMDRAAQWRAAADKFTKAM